MGGEQANNSMAETELILEQQEQLASEWIGGGARGDRIQRWLEFNHAPLRHFGLGVEWPKGLKGLPLEEILEDRRAARYLDHNLCKGFGWTADVPWAPERLGWRIAIARPERIREMVKYVGVLCTAEAIRRTISAKQVRDIKEYLGSKIHYFAMFRVPMLKLERPASCLLENWETRSPSREIEQMGRRVFALFFAKEPEGIRHRLALLIPEIEPDFSSVSDHFKENPPKPEAPEISEAAAISETREGSAEAPGERNGAVTGSPVELLETEGAAAEYRAAVGCLEKVSALFEELQEDHA